MTTNSAGAASTGMTAAAQPGPSTSTVLAWTCRAEWTRLRTVRSTSWFALATALAVLGIGTLLGLDVRSDPGSLEPGVTAWRGGQLAASFGLFGLLALAVVAATADYATKGIVASLQATPRRVLFQSARNLVIVGSTGAYGCMLAFAASGIVQALAPSLGLPPSEGVEMLAAVGFVHVTGGLIAVGLGTVARSTAGGLVTVFAVMLVLPLMLGSLPFGWSETVAELLPGTSAMVLLTGEAAVQLSDASAYATVSAWAIASVAAGIIRLSRTDADR